MDIFYNFVSKNYRERVNIGKLYKSKQNNFARTQQSWKDQP